MGSKIIVVIVIALAAYAVGFTVALKMPVPMTGAKNHGEAAGRANPKKALRSPKPAAQLAAVPKLEFLSPEVKAGQNASLTVRTLPGQVCTLRFVYPGQDGTDQSVRDYLTSDAEGLCTWSWTIPSDARSAVATVVIWAGGSELQRSFNIIP
jgi:hypothetical protein